MWWYYVMLFGGGLLGGTILMMGIELHARNKGGMFWSAFLAIIIIVATQALAHRWKVGEIMRSTPAKLVPIGKFQA